MIPGTGVAGEVRWMADDLGVRVETRGAPLDVRASDHQRLLFVGELHGDEPRAAERLTAFFTDRCAARHDAVAGSYALAIIDSGTRTLTLATDPFGICPLYYTSDGQRVVFGTRLADVVRLGEIRTDRDPTAIYHYLNFSYVPGPGTIFRDVLLLPPGSVAHCTNGKVDVRTYWDLAYPADLGGTETTLSASLRAELERAVRASWPAPARPGATGCFLSGGTDSGTIAAILSDEERGLNAYSIGFSEHVHDELKYATLLAERYHLRHHVHRLTADDLLQSIGPLVAALDQPFGNPSIVATWRCARLARETGVEMLIAGDGGDELFGGNERYAKDRIYAAYHRMPASVQRALQSLADAVPGESLVQRRLRNVAERGSLPNPDRLYSDDALASRQWDRLVSPGLARRVARDASLDLMRAHWDRIGPAHDVDRLMYVDLKTAIWGNDLVKVMMAARLAGVGVRFPFLDPALADFTGRLSARMKVRGVVKRYLFKRAVSDLLPARVLGKRKHGFSVPVAEWIRHDRRVREAVLDPILDPGSVLGDYFTRAGLDRLIDEHLKGAWDHGTWLWALMVLARWCQDQGSDHNGAR